MQEAAGLLGKKMTYDGTTLEIYVRGDSKSRFVASEIESIERKDRKGRLDVIIFSGGKREILAFDATQRARAEAILGAIESTRVAG